MMTLVSKPPSDLKRWLFRFPVFVYRIGLGRLMGGRFVLINHIGRKSGQLRQTVVEVASHDPASDVYFVASGWGYKAQWYQNLMAQPNVTIQVGARKLAVHAETLPPEAGAQVLLDYRAKHAYAAKELGAMMGLDIGHASAEALVTIVRDSLPIVAFRPRLSSAEER